MKSFVCKCLVLVAICLASEFMGSLAQGTDAAASASASTSATANAAPTSAMDLSMQLPGPSSGGPFDIFSNEEDDKGEGEGEDLFHILPIDLMGESSEEPMDYYEIIEDPEEQMTALTEERQEVQGDCDMLQQMVQDMTTNEDKEDDAKIGMTKKMLDGCQSYLSFLEDAIQQLTVEMQSAPSELVDPVPSVAPSLSSA